MAVRKNNYYQLHMSKGGDLEYYFTPEGWLWRKWLNCKKPGKKWQEWDFKEECWRPNHRSTYFRASDNEFADLSADLNHDEWIKIKSEEHFKFLINEYRSLLLTFGDE